jgi:hypothetical protein
MPSAKPTEVDLSSHGEPPAVEPAIPANEPPATWAESTHEPRPTSERVPEGKVFEPARASAMHVGERPKAAPATRRIPDHPRKPGFFQRGTVEPVVGAGVVLVLLSCLLAAIGEGADVGSLAAVGYLLGALGVIIAVVAILVALIRREAGRG